MPSLIRLPINLSLNEKVHKPTNPCIYTYKNIIDTFMCVFNKFSPCSLYIMKASLNKAPFQR